MKAHILFFGWLCFAGVLVADSTGPRPISEAERAAVSLAAEYLTSGPKSWWPALSSTAPLRDLGMEAAVKEIAVRCGPAGGATWQLQTAAPGWEDLVIFTIEFPSGLDETLSLQLVEEDQWRIDSIRILSEPAPHRAGIEEAFEDAGNEAVPGGFPPAAPWALAVVALIAAACYPKTGQTQRRVHVVGLILFVSCVLAWSCSQEKEESVAEAPYPKLVSLRTLREIVAQGGVDPEPLFAQLPAEGVEGEVGRIWEAAYRILRFELDKAQSILDTFPAPADIAAVEVLRARLGFLRTAEIETFLAFERALDIGPDYDGLRLEMALSYAQLGYVDKSEIAFALLANMGSRDPDVYYSLARFAILDNRKEEGIEHFQTAWELLPAERETLFSDPFLAYLATQPKVFPLLELASVQEPAVRRAPTDRRPLSFPEGAETRLSGDLLEVSLGDSTLRVPGGGALADEATLIEDAGARTRREESKALARLDALIEANRTPGALAQPLLRRHTQSAAVALFRDGEWRQLIELTDGLIHSMDHAPPLLAKLRARALTESGRSSDATDLLVELAKSDLNRGRQDPATLYQLAEVFATEEDYELAVRLLRKAESLTPFEPDYSRLQRFRMQQSLAENHQGYASRHFNIRYPKITGEKYARQVSIVLEEEWQRLQRWIPVQSNRLLDVDLFPIIEFLESYSENVLGIYDGRIRVPLADLRSLHPEIVALLSHELAHAMIAERTGNRAPMWFHEGLAQHVQMVQHAANPVGDLVSADRMLSLSVVDAVLNGFVEAQFVDVSYSLAAWFMHFIEREFDRPAISRLMKAFEAGQSTEEAFVLVLGVTNAEFDERFKLWALRQAPAVWPANLRRYDTEAAVAELLKGGKPRAVRSAPPAPPKGSTKALMKKWHRYYAPRFGGVKSTFMQVVMALRNNDATTSLKFACGQLRTESRRARADDRMQTAPDPKVSNSLGATLEDLTALAETCLQYEGGPQTHTKLKAAEKALVDLTSTLKPWGLQP